MRPPLFSDAQQMGVTGDLAGVRVDRQMVGSHDIDRFKAYIRSVGADENLLVITSVLGTARYKLQPVVGLQDGDGVILIDQRLGIVILNDNKNLGLLRGIGERVNSHNIISFLWWGLPQGGVAIRLHVSQNHVVQVGRESAHLVKVEGVVTIGDAVEPEVCNGDPVDDVVVLPCELNIAGVSISHFPQVSEQFADVRGDGVKEGVVGGNAVGAGEEVSDLLFGELDFLEVHSSKSFL